MGFDMSEAIWLSEDDLDNTQQLLMKYNGAMDCLDG